MTLSKFAVVVIGASLISAPVLAQSAGTSATGTSNGMQGTPSQPSSSAGTPMKGSNTMMKSSNGTMTKAPMAGEHPTATGGPSGGHPNKN